MYNFLLSSFKYLVVASRRELENCSTDLDQDFPLKLCLNLLNLQSTKIWSSV